MTATRYQTIWFRKGKAFLPSIGRTPSGMFFELDPVKVIDPSVGDVVTELARALETPQQAVQDRSRYGGDWPRASVVQTAAGLKSWASFAKGALGIAVIETPTAWQLSAGLGTSPADIENVKLNKDSSPHQVGGAVMALAERWPIWRSE